MKALVAGFALALLALPSLICAEALPEGPAKPLVEQVCSECHSLVYLERAQGYDTAEEWRHVMASMVDLPAAQARSISEYLAAHYPSKPEKAPTLVPGDFEIEITEWLVPTLGQRSRDPIEAPDGSIWWTGMWASLAGRLHPDTGQMEEFQLPPAARPHSILPDTQGNIWYMGNSNGTVGRLDPVTGLITEYHACSSMATRSATAMPRAPPEPPSPITMLTIGVSRRAISRRLTAIASAWPRCSAPTPG